MTCEVPWFHVGVATVRPKTGDLLGIPARGAGVDVVVLLQMFGHLLVLDSNMPRAVFPFAWVHHDLGIMVTQDFLVNQDGVHPVLLMKHVLDHQKFSRAKMKNSELSNKGRKCPPTVLCPY